MLYPGNIKKEYHKTVSYGNRGMKLEGLINDANKYYEVNMIALIYKKPTPVAINKVEYQETNKVKTTGYLKSKSTLDYVGVYKGRYLDFDAKSTNNKTSFPLDNIHIHQLEHIKLVIKHGGISFLIINMNNNNFILKGENLLDFIKNSDRKSIPYEHLQRIGFEIRTSYNPVLNYIETLDKIYF